MRESQRQRLQEVERLWREHSAAAFPDSLRERTIAGADAITFDSTVAGCVQTFVENKGKLDLWRTAILGLCYRDLAQWTAKLSGSDLRYFSRLEKLTKLVLEAVRDTARSAGA